MRSFTTPNGLHKSGYITSGSYTAWKPKFVESMIAERLHYNSKPYRIKGIDELTTNPVTAMIICDYILDLHDEERLSDYFFSIIRQIITAYEEDNTSSNLSHYQTNCICHALGGNAVFEDQPVSFITEKYAISDEEKKTVRQVVKKHSEYILTKMQETGPKNIKPYNSDGSHISFKPYLAPIIAALCQYHDSIPFLYQTDLWKECIDVYPIKNMKENTSMAENFAILKRYLDHWKMVEQQKISNDEFAKYEAFMYLIISKIMSDKNPIKGHLQIIQYYTCEKLFGFEWINIMANIICNQMQREQIAVDNIRDRNTLPDLFGCLCTLYDIEDPIVRIEISKSFLMQYWRDWKEDKVSWKKNSDRIRDMKLKYRINERGSIERLFCEKDFITVDELLDRVTNFDDKRLYFETYIEGRDSIKKVGEERNVSLPAIKNKVKSELAEVDTRYNNIKNGLLEVAWFYKKTPEIRLEK